MRLPLLVLISLVPLSASAAPASRCGERTGLGNPNPVKDAFMDGRKKAAAALDEAHRMDFERVFSIIAEDSCVPDPNGAVYARDDKNLDPGVEWASISSPKKRVILVTGFQGEFSKPKKTVLATWTIDFAKKTASVVDGAKKRTGCKVDAQTHTKNKDAYEDVFQFQVICPDKAGEITDAFTIGNGILKVVHYEKEGEKNIAWRRFATAGS